MKKAVRLQINGLLQSLFYRQYIKQNAEANEVKGFLRNKEDGIIEVFLEGEMDNVDSMIAICRTGPKHAKIYSVQEKQENLQGFKEFKILDF